MNGDDSTLKLLEEVMKQMSDLQSQVEYMQHAGTFALFDELSK